MIKMLTKQMEESEVKAKINRIKEELKRNKLLQIVDEEDETHCEAKKAIQKLKEDVKHADILDEFHHAEKVLMVPSQREKNLKKAADAIEKLSTESCRPDTPLTEKYFNSIKFQSIINKVVQNALANN